MHTLAYLDSSGHAIVTYRAGGELMPPKTVLLDVLRQSAELDGIVGKLVQNYYESMPVFFLIQVKIRSPKVTRDALPAGWATSALLAFALPSSASSHTLPLSCNGLAYTDDPPSLLPAGEEVG